MRRGDRVIETGEKPAPSPGGFAHAGLDLAPIREPGGERPVLSGECAGFDQLGVSVRRHRDSRRISKVIMSPTEAPTKSRYSIRRAGFLTGISTHDARRANAKDYPRPVRASRTRPVAPRSARRLRRRRLNARGQGSRWLCKLRRRGPSSKNPARSRCRFQGDRNDGLAIPAQLVNYPETRRRFSRSRPWQQLEHDSSRASEIRFAIERARHYQGAPVKDRVQKPSGERNVLVSTTSVRP